MIVSTYELFSPIVDTDSVLYWRDLSKRVKIDDQRVDDLKVAWPNGAVIYAVNMLSSHDTKFCRDVTSPTTLYRAPCQT